mgnify:FL=1
MATKQNNTGLIYIGFKVPGNIHKLLRLLAVESDTSVSSLMRELAVSKAVEVNTKTKGVRK